MTLIIRIQSNVVLGNLGSFIHLDLWHVPPTETLLETKHTHIVFMYVHILLVFKDTWVFRISVVIDVTQTDQTSSVLHQCEEDQTHKWNKTFINQAMAKKISIAREKAQVSKTTFRHAQGFTTPASAQWHDATCRAPEQKQLFHPSFCLVSCFFLII